MIRLVGGSLRQWDKNRKVTLTGRDAQASEVHFAQWCSSSKSLSVPIEITNGKYYAEIPNSYLMSDKDICVWTMTPENTMSGKIRLKVISCERPCDYVYCPTKVTNWTQMKQWVMNQFKDFQVEYSDYNHLKNKPRINEVELVGNRDLEDIGIASVTIEDIDMLFEEEYE